MNFASKLFFVIGVASLTLGLALFYQRYAPTRLAFAGEITSRAVVNPKYAPVEIYIPSLDIKLPIVSSEITNGQWETSSVGVNYLVTSPLPGDTGNSVLYGHNWSNLLGALPNIKNNDSIFITFENLSTREFRVSFTSVVMPTDIGVLERTQDKRITLYTCTGFMDRERFVVTAFLVE